MSWEGWVALPFTNEETEAQEGRWPTPNCTHVAQAGTRTQGFWDFVQFSSTNSKEQIQYSLHPGSQGSQINEGFLWMKTDCNVLISSVQGILRRDASWFALIWPFKKSSLFSSTSINFGSSNKTERCEFHSNEVFSQLFLWDKMILEN